MIITYYGAQFFKIQTGDTILAFNPVGKGSSFPASRFGADIALISLNHADFNGAEEVTYGEKSPFVIRGPGEYEVKDVFIKGFPVETVYRGAAMQNTIYTLTFDQISLCFLGALGDPAAITNETKEGVGEADILFVPIGGADGVLSPAAAHDASRMFDPKIIIPMHYDDGKDKTLAAFLKEAGEEGGENEKLTIKKKDLEGKEGAIVVLKNIAL